MPQETKGWNMDWCTNCTMFQNKSCPGFWTLRREGILVLRFEYQGICLIQGTFRWRDTPDVLKPPTNAAIAKKKLRREIYRDWENRPIR